MQAIQHFTRGFVLLVTMVWAVAAQSADRERLREFLTVTGFDVAITSMQDSAMAGPGIAGDAANDFGAQYTALAERVFDPDLMLERAIAIMLAGMPEDLIDHGIAFYESDLGKRLVAAENAAHATPDEERYKQGEALLATMVDDNRARVDDYTAMLDAIGGVEASVRAVVEVQLRYLLAAMAAGTIDIDYSEAELRALINKQAPQIRRDIGV
ncbi:MAG TPA: DUF2059 domain-containing protein, partial [Rhodobacterales bacterium]|nr:DUF2059 domain-containing protein [Rhodobacterales bacterium]